MLRKLLLTISLSLFWITISWAVTVQIGSGTTTNNYYPIYTCYGYSYSQQIYLESEITGAGGYSGTIEKIRFYYSSGGTSYNNWSDWTVYMGNTVKTSFASSTDWEAIASMSQVFSGTIPTPSSGTWVELTLSTPFNWDGSSNIIVAVDENSSSYSCTANWYSFDSGSSRGILYYSDGTNPDPASPPSANNGPSTSIAQIQFEFAVAGAPGAPTNPNPADNATDVAPSGNLTWDFGTNTDTYDLWFGPAGNMSQVITGSAAGTSGSYTYSANSGTEYEWQVIEYNSAKLTTNGPVWSFTTICGTITSFPFNEDFEGTFLPSCWTKIVNSGNDITQSSTENHTTGGTYSARFSSYSSSSDYNQYLFSPPVTVDAGYTQLSFWHKKYNSTELLEWGVAATTDPNDYTWTPVTLSYTQWQETTVDLSSYVGQTVYIGFHYFGDFTYYVYLDDVSIDVAPTCYDPSNLSASGITHTSADLGWTENGSATQWDIELGSAGFSPTGTPTQSGVTNPYTYSGLSAGTSYDWYVRSDCGGGDFSNWVGPNNFSTTQPGYTCNDPIIISSLPYIVSDNTSNYGDDYSSADDICSTSSYLNGDDVVYSYTPGINECVDITLTNTGTWVGLFVYEGCDPFTTCVDNDTQSGGNPSLSGVSLTGGTTYYIIISTYPSPQSTAYDLNIANCPACPDPTIQTETNITSASADLGWTDNVNSTWEIEWGASGFTPGSGTTIPGITTNPYNLSGLSPNTDYDWYIRADCGGGSYSNWVGASSFTTMALPPSNDDCSGAISLPVGYSCNYTTATNAGATDSGLSPGCANYSGGDVWFSADVPANGYLVIEGAANGGFTDGGMAVWTGTCGSLTLYECNDDGGPSVMPLIEINDIALAGQTVYISFWEYGNDSFGPFDICAHTSPSTATWTGNISNDWHDAGNWDTGVPGSITDVTIPAGLTNYPTISASALCNNISLGSDASGTATLLDNGYLIIYGTASVERYFSGNDPDWHLISVPIYDAYASVFTGMYLQSFDPTTYNYTEITDENTGLDPMTGYGLYSTMGATNTVTFNGHLNTGIQSKSIVTGPDSYNWNLIGNPFPSSIDWETVTIPTNMTNEVHYIEAATGNDLAYVQGTGGTGSQYIAPMQGFFVSATGTDALQIGNTERTHAGAGNFYKNDNPNLLILEAAGENYADDTWIHFNEEAGVEHDGQYDAYKRISLSNPELPQLFSYTPSGEKLAINGLPQTEMVPVGFTTVESGQFTISAKETGEFSDIVLEDLLLNTLTDLTQESYTFDYEAGSMENRFIVHFAPLGINDNLADNVNIYSYNKDVYVTVPASTNGTIKIYDMMGQEVAAKTINNIVNKVTLSQSAYYVVVVVGDEIMMTEKVFVK